MSCRDRAASVASALCAVLLCAAPALAQPVVNEFAVRVDGSQNAHYEDQFYLVCDDAVPGANSAACDVGAGDFSYELWIRAETASNANPSRGSYGPDTEVFAYDWIDGNIFLDRDVWGGSCDGRDFGAAILDGRIGFGTGGGPAGFTLYGSTPVNDGQWHHVALVREAGVALRIYVDGVLDVESTQYAQVDDLSIPDAGCTQGSAISPEHQPILVIGQEKHGLAGISLSGDFDELRIWASARSGTEIASTWNRVIDCADPALVGYYRFEAGGGGVGGDRCQRSPDGVVDNGTPGRGEWIADAPLLVPEPHAALLGLVVCAALGVVGRDGGGRRPRASRTSKDPPPRGPRSAPIRGWRYRPARGGRPVSDDTRVHLVSGGFPPGSHAGHDMDFARLRLLERLHETPGVVTTTSSDFGDIEKWLTGASLLITYVAGPFPDDAQSAAIDAWLGEGGRWFALHGTSGGKAAPIGDDRRVRSMVKMRHHQSLGCFFLNHPPLRTFQVDTAAESHPLLRDLPPSFDVADELYLLEILDPGCQPLLTTKLPEDPSPEGFGFVYDREAHRPADGETRVLGYEKRVGAGAVAYVALGHCHAPTNNVQPFVDASVAADGTTPTTFRGAWETPAFDQLLRNAIAWGTSP